MPDRYDVFISYSRQADADVAGQLQRQLQQFAKPVFRRRALHVFRDDSNLSANPGLWTSIQQALDRSDRLLVLGSVAAAASEWVGREVTYWRETKPDGGILLAVTDGDVSWDERAGDFDPSPSTAIPAGLAGAFPEEPRYVDLRWTADQSALNAKDPRFSDAVADLAAPLHDRPKDELVGEDLRQHRRLVRLTRGAVALLVLLTVAAMVAAIVAIGQRNEASQQRDEATQQREEATRQRDEATRQREEATRQRDEATRQRDEAERQTQIAQVRELSARSLASTDPFEALALGVQAELTTDTPRPEARDAYARAAQRVGQLPLLPLGGPVDAHTSPGTAVDFSADGSLLATGAEDGTVKVWDAQSRELIDEFAVTDSVRSMAFSPTRNHVAVGDGAGSLWIWSPGREGGRTRRVRMGDAWLTAVSWSRDGRRITVGTFDGRILVVDFIRGAPGAVHHLATRSNILAVAWVDDRIAYVAQELDAGTIDPLTGAGLTQFRLFPHGDLHEGVVIEAGFSPDGTVVATIADSDTPFLWDSITGRRIAGPYAASFGAVEWSLDGRQFLSGETDLYIHDRELGSAEPFLPVPVHHGTVEATAWSPDGGTLATMSDDGSLRWWSVRTGRDAWDYDEPTSIRWVTDGIVGLSYSGLQRWSVSGGTPAVGPPVPEGGFLSPDGSQVAASEVGWLAVYDVTAGAFGPSVEAAPNGFVSTIAWSPDGSRLASQAAHDATRTVRGQGDHLRIWAVGADGRLTETAALLIEDRYSRLLGWTPDGASLVLVDPEGLSIWNPDDAAPTHVLDAAVELSEIWFDPSGSRAALRVDGSSVRIFDTTTWRWVGEPYRGFVAAWSPDGTLLTTASETLQVFDVATGTPLGRPVPLSEWGVVRLAWSPDGRRIAAAGGLDPPVLQLVESWTETDACALVIDALGAGGVDELIGDGRTSVCNQEVTDIAPSLPVVLVRFG
jgi:WD40 repeat protein